MLFSPDGKLLLVAGRTGANTIWDFSSGKQIGEFAPPPSKTPEKMQLWWGDLCFSPDGTKLLASKYGSGTWLWTWPERKVIWHVAETEGLAFHDNQVYLSADWNQDIKVCDVQTRAVKRTIPHSAPTAMIYSPNRLRLVTTHLDGTVRIRDSGTGDVLKELRGFREAWSTAFSPSGWLMAAAGDKEVRIYETVTWQEMGRLQGHTGTVRSVNFGADDATVISDSCDDGTVLIWSLNSKGNAVRPDPAKLWDELGRSEGAAAVWSLAAHSELATKLFRAKWPVPEKSVDVEQVKKLIRELDDDRFKVREAATMALVKLGRQVETELRKASRESGSAEFKSRIEKILETWKQPSGAEYAADQVRELRAVWALELANTAESRQLLEDWAKTRVGNRLCEEADLALKRLRARSK
jgi:hypothetical protein